MSWMQRLKQPVIAYTDGSCPKNPGGPGGWAVVLVREGVVVELSGGLVETTNNRAELTACIQALRALPAGSNVYVYTDSQYVQRGITQWVYAWKKRGWVNTAQQPVANQDLWQALDAEQERHMVSWHWVRGHDGDPYNERCDVLAAAACTQVPTDTP